MYLRSIPASERNYHENYLYHHLITLKDTVIFPVKRSLGLSTNSDGLTEKIDLLSDRLAMLERTLKHRYLEEDRQQKTTQELRLQEQWRQDQPTLNADSLIGMPPAIPTLMSTGMPRVSRQTVLPDLRAATAMQAGPTKATWGSSKQKASMKAHTTATATATHAQASCVGISISHTWRNIAMWVF